MIGRGDWHEWRIESVRRLGMIDIGRRLKLLLWVVLIGVVVVRLLLLANGGICDGLMVTANVFVMLLMLAELRGVRRHCRLNSCVHLLCLLERALRFAKSVMLNGVRIQ